MSFNSILNPPSSVAKHRKNYLTNISDGVSPATKEEKALFIMLFMIL